MSGAAKLHELPAKWRAEAARMFAHLTHSPHGNTYEWCADELSAALAEAGWPPPADAGVCAYDLDECTVTLALSSEEEVREANRLLPSRNRVRVLRDDD